MMNDSTMGYTSQLRQAALGNARGASHLESRLFVDALTEFVEAHRISLSIRQGLEDSGQISLPLQGVHRCLASSSSRQLVFPILSDDESSTGTARRESTFDSFYVYPRALAFATSDGSAMSDRITHPDPHCLLHNCNLFLATCAYNMGLCFHLRGKVLDEPNREVCRRVALDLYNTAIDTISIDKMSVARQSESDEDSSSLLVILLNNKAVLCFEEEDYDTCHESRKLLVLWLHICGGVFRPAGGFLSSHDVQNMYRNGFLLVPPTIAGCA